jgi:hypothetical protein
VAATQAAVEVGTVEVMVVAEMALGKMEAAQAAGEMGEVRVAVRTAVAAPVGQTVVV